MSEAKAPSRPPSHRYRTAVLGLIAVLILSGIFANELFFESDILDREYEWFHTTVPDSIAAAYWIRQLAPDFSEGAVELVLPTDDADLNDALCQQGAAHGLAEVVLPCCNRAVGLAPTSALYRDSRGVARLLLEDFAGARRDFNFFLAWAEENGMDDPLTVQREAWVVAINAGQDPLQDCRRVFRHRTAPYPTQEFIEFRFCETILFQDAEQPDNPVP
jgi:hypothetical protein